MKRFISVIFSLLFVLVVYSQKITEPVQPGYDQVRSNIHQGKIESLLTASDGSIAGAFGPEAIGLYFVQVVNEANTEVLKLIIEK